MQQWARASVSTEAFVAMLDRYDRRWGIRWKWVALDSATVKAQRGDLTGPSPTDRAKGGVKRHLLTDARGVPLAAVLSPANVHNQWTLAEKLDSVVLHAPRGPSPEHLCLDKGYCCRDCDAIVRARQIVPHIRPKVEPPHVGRVHGKPRRRVVERTRSWCNRYRALRVRWERKAINYLALFHFACALIALQHS
jgi:transposase